MFYSSDVCYLFSCLDWQGKNICWIIKWIEWAEWAFDEYILLFPNLHSKRFQSSYCTEVRAGAKKKKVEGGGEKRKRLPATPRILENGPWYFTIGFKCKLTARQNRSIMNRLPLDYQICKLSKCQKWFFRNNSLRQLYVLQSGCSSACVETFSTIHAAKFPINKNNLFISKSWQIACPWRL